MHFNAAMLEVNARLHQIDQLARQASQLSPNSSHEGPIFCCSAVSGLYC